MSGTLTIGEGDLHSNLWGNFVQLYVKRIVVSKTICLPCHYDNLQCFMKSDHTEVVCMTYIVWIGELLYRDVFTMYSCHHHDRNYSLSSLHVLCMSTARTPLYVTWDVGGFLNRDTMLSNKDSTCEKVFKKMQLHCKLQHILSQKSKEKLWNRYK